MNKAKQLILPISYPDSGRWYAPVKKIRIDDRTFALRMGEPVQLGTCYEIAKEFRIGRRVLGRLADISLIERMRPSPFLSMYYYADIAAFLERTRTDPAFWSSVRKEAYLNGDSPQEASLL